VTSIVAVSAETVKSLEDAQIVDGKVDGAEGVTAAAISISGAEYVRTSGRPIGTKEPYYLYRTKDAKAGNPISMLYAETPVQTQNFLFGTWANSYFFSPGATAAYSFCMNEDLYMSLWNDQTVCCKLPVRLFDSYESVKIADPASETQPVETQPAETQPAETQPAGTKSAETQPVETQPAETQPAGTESAYTQSAETQPAETPSTEEPTNDDSMTEQSSTEPSTTEAPVTEAPTTEVPVTEGPVTEVPAEPGKYINLTMLTPRDGLPASAGRITGMRDPSAPYIERTERSDRNNKYQASVFGKGGTYALIIGGVLILAAAAAIIIRKSSAKNKSKSAKPKGRR